MTWLITILKLISKNLLGIVIQETSSRVVLKTINKTNDFIAKKKNRSNINIEGLWHPVYKEIFKKTPNERINSDIIIKQNGIEISCFFPGDNNKKYKIKGQVKNLEIHLNFFPNGNEETKTTYILKPSPLNNLKGFCFWYDTNKSCYKITRCKILKINTKKQKQKQKQK